MDRKKAKISKVNDRSLYGKTPLESWTGTVVSYDAQKDQLEGGWGWRYKVRIMGENTQSDTITSEKIDYAYCLLPTTAGSGGAYKLRSVRISQGDYVYGVKGGGGPTMIIGVYPRTSKQVPGSGNFENLSGFYGSLKNTGIISGEFNEQIGPNTPGLPSSIDKSNRAISQREVASLGITPNDPNTESQGNIISNIDKKLTPPTTPEDKPYDGESTTKQQLKFSLENSVFSVVVPRAGFSVLIPNEQVESVENLVDQINKANLQNIISKDTTKKMINFVLNGEGHKAAELLNLGETPINETL